MEAYQRRELENSSTREPRGGERIAMNGRLSPKDSKRSPRLFAYVWVKSPWVQINEPVDLWHYTPKVY